MRLIIALIILTLLGLMLPAVKGQTNDSANESKCAPAFNINISPPHASIGNGYINFCVTYPSIVAAGSTFQVISILTAPPTVSPMFNSAAVAFSAISGCTEGASPTQLSPSTNGVIGTMVTQGTTFTMTTGSDQCDFVAGVTLAIGVTVLQIYSATISMMARTEDLRVDNFNFLCDAPGIVPNSYSETTTTCNDVIFSLSGTINAVMSGALALSGTLTVSDDANGWTIHQDPISGSLTICPVSAPCYHVLSGALNSTVSINGNVSVNQTNLPPQPKDGWDGSLYILVTVLGLIIAHLGESRRDNVYRVFGGLLLLVGAYIIVWELQRLGFNNVLDGYGLGFAIGFILIQACVALYLMYPKSKEEETE